MRHSQWDETSTSLRDQKWLCSWLCIIWLHKRKEIIANKIGRNNVIKSILTQNERTGSRPAHGKPYPAILKNDTCYKTWSCKKELCGNAGWQSILWSSNWINKQTSVRSKVFSVGILNNVEMRNNTRNFHFIWIAKKKNNPAFAKNQE